MVNRKVIRQLYRTEPALQIGSVAAARSPAGSRAGLLPSHDGEMCEHSRALEDGEQHSCSLPTRCQEHNTHFRPADCSNQMCPHGQMFPGATAALGGKPLELWLLFDGGRTHHFYSDFS